MSAYWDDEVNVITGSSKQRESIRGASNRPQDQSQSVSAELDALFANLPSGDQLFLPKSSSEGRKGGAGSSRRGVNVLLSDNEDANGAGQPQTGGDDGDASKSKKKRTIAKLDEERLRGPNGFPALIEQHTKFKSSGKGNETKDLQRLLQIYQLWSHKMYPKTQFRDTIERIEKICHSRSMHIALNKWKEDLAPKPLVPSRDSSPVNEDDTAADDALRDNNQDSSEAHQPSAAPRSRVINPGDDNVWDFGALIAEDIESRAQPESSGQSQQTGSPTQKASVGLDAEGECDVDVMIEEQETDERGVGVGNATSASGAMDDDEEMWSMAREIEMSME